jgi:enoyl-CoA hydratase/carnithine racemase
VASDIEVTANGSHVTTIEIRRPPHNYLDDRLIADLADTLARLDADSDTRVAVLCTAGKSFCAGGDHTADNPIEAAPGSLSREVIRLFDFTKPLVAAVQGPAIGAGLGLALAADFRVASPEARFSANFALIGLHHGFALTATLPAVVGQQKALELLLTGRRMKGDEAFQVGLCDRLVPLDVLRDAAHAFAMEIAACAPLSLVAIKHTMVQ